MKPIFFILLPYKTNMINKITRIFDCIEYQKNNYPQDKSLVYKEKNNWKSYSSQDFITISNNVSRSLLKLGLKPNDKVAIMVKSGLFEKNYDVIINNKYNSYDPTLGMFTGEPITIPGLDSPTS